MILRASTPPSPHRHATPDQRSPTLKSKEPLKAFVDTLGRVRFAAITLVSAGADWVADVVAACCSSAVRCADPFPLVAWATDALDEVRRHPPHVGNDARRAGDTAGARTLKDARYALGKNPADLTEHQQVILAWIAAVSRPRRRAYELTEAFRKVIRIKGVHGSYPHDDWIARASRSKLTPIIELARKIRRHRQAIKNTTRTPPVQRRDRIDEHQDPAPDEDVLWVKNTDTLIALAMLALGGYRPTLPG